MVAELEAAVDRAGILRATGTWDRGTSREALIWEISRDGKTVRIENHELRAWCMIHIAYPFNHVDSVRTYHCEAYFNHYFNLPQPASSFVRLVD